MGKLKQREGLRNLFKVIQLEALVLEVEPIKLVPKSFWGGEVVSFIVSLYIQAGFQLSPLTHPSQCWDTGEHIPLLSVLGSESILLNHSLYYIA